MLFRSHFSEITASNLIVVDEKGNRLAGHGQVRAVAFYLHGRLHKALPGAKCILHAHAPYSTAISLVRGGRLGKAHGIAMGLGRLVCYDDEMQGPVNDDEADRLIRIVGPDKRIIFHAMHGMTTLGATVAEAYDNFYFAERMSMYTVLARQMSDDLHAAIHLPQWGLTPRQTDVLASLLKGHPNKLIARELNLSVETVKDHVAAVLRDRKSTRLNSSH